MPLPCVRGDRCRSNSSSDAFRAALPAPLWVCRNSDTNIQMSSHTHTYNSFHILRIHTNTHTVRGCSHICTVNRHMRQALLRQPAMTVWFLAPAWPSTQTPAEPIPHFLEKDIKNNAFISSNRILFPRISRVVAFLSNLGEEPSLSGSIPRGHLWGFFGNYALGHIVGLLGFHSTFKIPSQGSQLYAIPERIWAFPD